METFPEPNDPVLCPAFGNKKVDEVDSLSTNNIELMDRENEEIEKEETRPTTPNDDMQLLSPELQAGYKILCDLMAESKKATNWPFMESIEVSAPELYQDYKKHIEKPMWLKLMRQKFEDQTYGTITDFVSDFRLMLENCYRYNGPDHYVSKRGQKLEIMLEQKLALLPRDLREKTSIEATSGIKMEDTGSGLGLRRRPKSVVPHDSTVLLNQLREAEQQKVREYRKQQLLDRRAEKEALVQEINDWEDKVLFIGQTRDHMKTMWELPQIGLFLFLCQEPLNIGEVMQFELERSFLMPRESATMQLVMTSLLSTPFQRLKLCKKTLMPYNIWEQKLRVKVQQWYKVYTDSGFNLEETCLKLGMESQLFEVLGKKNPLEKRKYHELSFCKKIWLMKALCDHCLNTQDYLRESIENQPYHDQREYVLGTDAQGQRYIHFPQFCGADVRIYRQAAFKYPKLEIKPDPFDNKRKFPLVYKPPPKKKMKVAKQKKVVDSSSPSVSPVRQRPSRLRQTVKTVVPLQLGAESSGSESSLSEEETQEEEEEEEGNLTTESQDNRVQEKEGQASDENELTDNKDEDRLSCGSDATIPYCDKSDCNSSISSRDCSRESSPYLNPLDLGLRRSARLDKYSDTSRDASPLIFDSDFGLRRSSRNRARLKNIPPTRAARNITNMLMDDNSTASNSSAFCGENSLSGLWKDRLSTNENSRSSDNGEESNDCDMYKKLFSSYSEQNKAEDWMQSEDKTNSSSDSKGKLFESKDLSTDTADESEKMAVDATYDKCSKNENIVSDTLPVSDDDNEGDVDEEDGETGEAACVSADDVDTNSTENVEAVVDTNKSDLKVLDKQKTECEHDDMDVEVRHSENAQMEEFESDVIMNGSVNDGENEGNVMMDDTGKDPHLGLNGFVGHDGDLKSDTNMKVTNLKQDVHSDSEHIEKSHQNIHAAEEESQLAESSHEINCAVNSHENNEDDKSTVNDAVDTNLTCDLIIKSEPSDEYDLVKTKSEDAENESTQNTLDVKVEITDSKLNNSVAIKQEVADDVKDENVEESLKYGNLTKSEVSESDRLENKLDTNVKTETEEDNDCKVSTKNKETEPGVEIKTEEPESEEEEDQAPDPSQFELLAESVDELRKLVSQFAEPEPIIIKKGKKEQITYPPPRKRNVVILHERLEYLLKELEPWESKLQQANRRARIRVRKEKEDYIEPPSDQNEQWNSTDEETESGNSDDESKTENTDSKEDKSLRTNTNKALKATDLQTGLQPKVSEVDEIDVSQRGRLRKRRIIPNNVEDQLASKKPKIKTEPVETSKPVTSQPSSSQPIIIQSGKPQMVDYSDILRQLRSVNSSGSQMPILIRTTQGGRTVLTSVLPISSTSAVGSSPQVLSSSQSAVASRSHPTIQTLLTASLPSPGFNIVKPTSNIQILPQSTTKNVSATNQPVMSSVNSSKPFTPLKIQLGPGQATVQPLDPQPLSPSSSPKTSINQSITPKKIAPHTQSTPSSVSGGKVKYYPANASTLPINVVQQLLATRGAKLQTGPNQQSILYIPMETEGGSRNSPAPVKHQFLSPVKKKLDKTDQAENAPQLNIVTSMVTMATTASVASTTTAGNNVASSSGPMLILPKSQIVMAKSSVPTLASSVLGSHMIQGILPPVSTHSSNIVTPAAKDGVITIKPLLHGQPQARLGVDVTKTYHTLPPTSPPRYPTNETVRTLLDKKKSGDEKVPTLRQATPSTYPCIVSQLQGAAPQPMPSTVLLKASPKRKQVVGTDTITTAVHSVQESAFKHQNMTADATTEDSCVSVKLPNAQPCVITSISPAKLNTLLLQTTAAGAKSIPSLIKLPSKAVLDSAVKAVVTSVPTTLPTVNIKVPSPTSLPSIGPRRNVTKTIQTMKSPIPVAPKVITQSSGNTTLSVANSNSVSLTHQVSASGSPLTVQGASPFMSAIAPTPAGATSTSSTVQKNQLAAVLQDVDGKKILTKVAPQTFLTSNGLVQVGYMTPQGMIIPKLQQQAGAQQSTTVTAAAVKQEPGSPSLQGVQLVQNSAGQLQLVQRTSPVLQQAAIKTNLIPLGTGSSQAANSSTLQGVRPVIALNTSGNPVLIPQASAVAKPVQQVITNLTTATSPAAILPKSSTICHTTPIKSQVSNTVVPQPAKSPVLGRSLKSPVSITGDIHTAVKHPPSPVLMAKPPLSPVINMQPGFIIPNAGLQLPNQIGVNLLQPGVAVQTAFVPSSQKMNLLQTSTANQASLQLYLNQSNNTALAGNKLVLQSPTTSQFPAAAQKSISTLTTGANNLSQILPTQYQAQTPASVGKFVLQQQASAGKIPQQTTPVLSQHTKGMQVQSVVKNLNTTFTTGAAADTEVKRSINTMIPAGAVAHKVIAPQNNASTSGVVNSIIGAQLSASSASSAQSALTKVSEGGTGGKATPQQQKLLLFSIGGQLVTGQGVPVTLSDGVLKLMPQAKVQIANQTLSPEQIQQTLSKINHAAATSLTLAQHAPKSSTAGVSMTVAHAANSTPTSSVMAPALSISHDGSQQTGRHLDHSYQHKAQKVLTVPVSLATPGSTVARLTGVSTSTSQLSPRLVTKPDSAAVVRTDGQFKPVNIALAGSATTNDHYGNGNAESGTSSVNSAVKKQISGQKEDKVSSMESKKCLMNSSSLKPGGVVNGNQNNDNGTSLQAELAGRDTRPGKGSNSHLVLDEKEAALNLLTLANQGREPMLVGDRKVDNSGDA